MEPAAARASITFLQDAGLNIKVFVTDRSIPLATFDKDRSQITVVDRQLNLGEGAKKKHKKITNVSLYVCISRK